MTSLRECNHRLTLVELTLNVRQFYWFWEQWKICLMESFKITTDGGHFLLLLRERAHLW